MKLLCLSNGHGEDLVAARVIRQLPQPLALKIAALPLVGTGYAYQTAKIPIVGPVKTMPSGGFIYMEGQQLWQDLRHGLLNLTLKQIKTVRQWGQSGGVILAVGDLFPLLLAWLSGANYAFIGTAKSEYYLRDNQGKWLAQTSWFERRWGSVYYPWERWLMSQRRCRAVFPRDSLTTQVLQQWPLPAYDLGNPMMDDLSPTTAAVDQAYCLTILLLPGSRLPEARRNWQLILRAINHLVDCHRGEKIKLIAAIAPALSLSPFIDCLGQWGWQKHTSTEFQLQTARLQLSQSDYAQNLQTADLAIAMAGTATEQLVGCGKPAFIMPGGGPQFTPAFAEAQTRLLGPSVILVEQPEQMATAIGRFLQNPDLANLVAKNGRLRMGTPGASQRIAQCLIKQLLG